MASILDNDEESRSSCFRASLSKQNPFAMAFSVSSLRLTSCECSDCQAKYALVKRQFYHRGSISRAWKSRRRKQQGSGGGAGVNSFFDSNSNLSINLNDGDDDDDEENENSQPADNVRVASLASIFDNESDDDEHPRPIEYRVVSRSDNSSSHSSPPALAHCSSEDDDEPRSFEYRVVSRRKKDQDRENESASSLQQPANDAPSHSFEYRVESKTPTSADQDQNEDSPPRSFEYRVISSKQQQSNETLAAESLGHQHNENEDSPPRSFEYRVVSSKKQTHDAQVVAYAEPANEESSLSGPPLEGGASLSSIVRFDNEEPSRFEYGYVARTCSTDDDDDDDDDPVATTPRMPTPRRPQGRCSTGTRFPASSQTRKKVHFDNDWLASIIQYDPPTEEERKDMYYSQEENKRMLRDYYKEWMRKKQSNAKQEERVMKDNENLCLCSL